MIEEVVKVTNATALLAAKLHIRTETSVYLHKNNVDICMY